MSAAMVMHDGAKIRVLIMSNQKVKEKDSVMGSAINGQLTAPCVRLAT